ncbi:MAG: 4Fe-4S dicluster domain-containing protein, partial [Elusimicrobiota bacterium]
REVDFQLGLDLMKKLADGPLHLCCTEFASTKALIEAKGVSLHRFNGKQQSGDAAVQVYHVAPPGPKETVWTVGYQDLLTISRSLSAGHLVAERVVGFGGPGASEPRTLRTRLGAAVESVTRGKVRAGEMRYVSGGILNGTAVDAAGHLGFYDSSLIVLPEGRGRELLGFVRPGFGRYSLSRAWISSFLPGGEHDFNTNLGGSLRNFVLQGVEEDLCPVGIWPQEAAKAVLAEDFEEMEKHGVLDCAECGLCTFVCPSKIEVAEILRRGIDMIHKEG